MAAFKKAYICIVVLLAYRYLLHSVSLFLHQGGIFPNRTLIYLLYLGNSVFTYLCADKNALITVTQKSYWLQLYPGFCYHPICTANNNFAADA
jgi:hypothetical protein